MCRCKPEIKQDNKPIIADCTEELNEIENLKMQLKEKPKYYEEKDEDPEPEKGGLKTADIFLN
jgi:hypothetical protein